jgi:hypothetical protein
MIKEAYRRYTSKLIKFIHNKIWWRRDFRRVYITEREALKGRCLICHAGRRNSYNTPCCGYDNDCPCKYNQRLIVKKEILV